MNRRKYVLGVVKSIVDDDIKAELVLERLEEEGVLHLGYGDADIDRVVTTFTETFGTTRVSKYDRFAAQRLVRKYGAQSVVGIISLLAANSTEKYAPVVNSVQQLEEKLPSILNFLRNVKGDEVII